MEQNKPPIIEPIEVSSYQILRVGKFLLAFWVSCDFQSIEPIPLFQAVDAMRKVHSEECDRDTFSMNGMVRYYKRVPLWNGDVCQHILNIATTKIGPLPKNQRYFRFALWKKDTAIIFFLLPPPIKLKTPPSGESQQQILTFLQNMRSQWSYGYC
jgi:hypothetical protein